jgi:NAD-specific glutamate dehydrogenase
MIDSLPGRYYELGLDAILFIVNMSTTVTLIYYSTLGYSFYKDHIKRYVVSKEQMEYKTDRQKLDELFTKYTSLTQQGYVLPAATGEAKSIEDAEEIEAKVKAKIRAEVEAEQAAASNARILELEEENETLRRLIDCPDEVPKVRLLG